MTRVEKPTLPLYQIAALDLAMGDLVAFPTETVYGLGADALNPEAIEKIFSAKGRPGDNPLIVHVEKLRQVAPLIDGAMPQKAALLAEAFWPGPLTMIFKDAGRVPRAVTAGLGTIAIRIPKHPVAQGLLHAFGRPIAAPSANSSGRPSPTTAAHVYEDLDGWLPLIIDGGPCEIGLESTVIDMTPGIPRLLRPGGVTVEMIQSVIGEIDVDEAVMKKLADTDKPRSPGTKYRHYAPKGRMTLVSGAPEAVKARICALYDEAQAQGKRSAILAAEDHAAHYGARRVFELGAPGDAAKVLFSALRSMDDTGIEEIFAESFEKVGMGLAVMNRLVRAAGFRQIEA